ncbi:MAG: ankyrin repeat domain-containing protein [Fibrella sp.]|nr:ankyrin repeat domain-containing protein [Armatimonadota bacterium]
MSTVSHVQRLCTAAERGEEQAVAALLAAGVPADAPYRHGVTQPDDVTGWTALMFACQGGHEGVARLLLDAGADPNHHAWCDDTPILLAARRGHSGLLRLLLAHGARTRVPFPLGGSIAVITAAAQGGSVEAVRLLLDAGEPPDSIDTDNGYTPLMVAVVSGHADVVRLLLTCGADPTLRNTNGGNALASAIHYANPAVGDKSWKPGHDEILTLILATNPALDLRQAAALGDAGAVQKLLDAGANVNDEDPFGRTALRCAVSNNHTEVAGLLWERGGLPGRPRRTLLALAAERGHVKMAAYILDRGLADIQSDGPVALDYAVMERQADVVRFLLGRGVDANMGNGRPLESAASLGYAEVLRLLLSHDADPNRVDADGTTPLMWAARSYEGEAGIGADAEAAVAALLEHGADPTPRDREGRTALIIAEEKGNEGAAHMLRRFATGIVTPG